MFSTRPFLARPCFPRRTLHTSTDDTRQRLRQLLRETAQPVAVVTALLPTSTSTSTYHGATLSSFTSIALDPFPLVAFSLRIPSRMASALSAPVALASSSSPSSSPLAHLVINILSAAQPHLADRFARPDLYPHPFQDPLIRHTPSQEGLPVLANTLGALSCYLVGPSLPLAHLCESHAFEDEPVREGETEGEVQQVSGGAGLPSELFIARVLRVERVPLLQDEQQIPTGPYKLPLLYHRRRYTTVGDHTRS